MDVMTVTASDFDKLVAEKIRVEPNGSHATDEHFEVELISVDRQDRILAVEGDNPARTRAPFSLLFRGDAENAFRSGVCNLVTEDDQLVDVFVSRILSPDPLPHYEVVFA